VRAEGWKWVEVLPTADYSDLSKYGRIYPVAVQETPTLRAEIEALQGNRRKSKKNTRTLTNTRRMWTHDCPRLKGGSMS
jgi:hypothetical protein